jgi:hypothetical protein
VSQDPVLLLRNRLLYSESRSCTVSPETDCEFLTLTEVDRVPKLPKPPLTCEQRNEAFRILVECADERREHVDEILRLLMEFRASKVSAETETSKEAKDKAEKCLRGLRMCLLTIAQLGSGGNCPFCGGHIQIQYRVINSAMVRALTELWKHFHETGKIPGTDYVKPEDVIRSASRCRELPKLRFHEGFIHGRPGNPGASGVEGTRSTTWTPLLIGLKYIRGNIKVQRWMLIFHDRLVGLAGPLQGVAEVERFNLQEYMEEVGSWIFRLRNHPEAGPGQ